MAPVKFKTVQDLLNEWPILHSFIGTSQLKCVVEALRGDEGQWFESRMMYFNQLLHTMPHEYQQDGLGKDAVAHLHYFKGGVDHYITERDSTPAQHQAFGLTSSHGMTELGYISIQEMIACEVELDFHFHPTAIRNLT